MIPTKSWKLSAQKRPETIPISQILRFRQRGAPRGWWSTSKSHSKAPPLEKKGTSITASITASIATKHKNSPRRNAPSTPTTKKVVERTFYDFSKI